FSLPATLQSSFALQFFNLDFECCRHTCVQAHRCIIAAKISGKTVTTKIKGGASGKLYGKVTGKEVAELLTQLT
ncbi:hypothetical protein H6B10_17345, partial [Gemmiger formicilis]|uniref:50S ribosomal L9 C-terminal domain-containing protein n=1 Tax=Gemmiger formicilis TaxID=745368 RepID=UPI001DC03FD4